MSTDRDQLAAAQQWGWDVNRYECEDCGLAAMDLPDGFDPEFIFERGDDGVMRCQGCQIQADR